MDAHPAEVCLPWFLDMRIQSTSCQRWYFVRDFGYEDAELLLDFWIIRSRARLANVGTLSRNFGYEDADLILSKLVLCLGFWI